MWKWAQLMEVSDDRQFVQRRGAFRLGRRFGDDSENRPQQDEREKRCENGNNQRIRLKYLFFHFCFLMWEYGCMGYLLNKMVDVWREYSQCR